MSKAITTQFDVVSPYDPPLIHGCGDSPYARPNPPGYTVELRIEGLSKAEVRRLYQVLVQGANDWEGARPTPKATYIEAEFVEAETRPLLPSGRR